LLIKLNQNKRIKLVTLKLWTSIFETLTFRDLTFWYHNLGFSWLFRMNQNDITWLASQLPSLSCCVAVHCQRSRVLSVRMPGWLPSVFMEWDYHILCFRKWFYFINYILFVFYFVVVTLLLILVFRDFLETNRRFALHMFVISDFFVDPN
jgi:hypothetical protein